MPKKASFEGCVSSDYIFKSIFTTNCAFNFRNLINLIFNQFNKSFFFPFRNTL